MALALMVAVNWVADTNVVGTTLPMKMTTEPATKPFPLTVRAMQPLPVPRSGSDL